MKDLCALTIKIILQPYYTLTQYQSKVIHKKCLEFLMIKVYKYLHNLSPQVMNDIFKLRKNTHNLRNAHLFESQNPRTKR